VLPSRLEHYNLPVPLALKHGTNVYSKCFARMRIALPLERYDLKTLAQWIKYPLRHPELSGLVVAYRYEDAIRHGKLSAQLLQESLEYREDDVLALRAFVTWLEPQLAERIASPSRAPSYLARGHLRAETCDNGKEQKVPRVG
jgi:hypothetical protein